MTTTITATHREPAIWKSRHAFGWPRGSVRAVLALLVFGGIWAWLARWPMREVPPYLQNLMFIIMGHYFAARSSSDDDDSPPPLYLPKGSVRAMLVLGFVAITGLLFYRQQMYSRDGGFHFSHSGVTLILIAGFLLGVVRHQLFPNSKRWLEDLRATIARARDQQRARRRRSRGVAAMASSASDVGSGTTSVTVRLSKTVNSSDG